MFCCYVSCERGVETHCCFRIGHHNGGDFRIGMAMAHSQFHECGYAQVVPRSAKGVIMGRDSDDSSDDEGSGRANKALPPPQTSSDDDDDEAFMDGLDADGKVTCFYLLLLGRVVKKSCCEWL